MPVLERRKHYEHVRKIDQNIQMEINLTTREVTLSRMKDGRYLRPGNIPVELLKAPTIAYLTE